MNLNNYLDSTPSSPSSSASNGAAPAQRALARAAAQLPARSMRQQSLAGVQAALLHSLRISKAVVDPTHPDLLSADKALAAASTRLATLPNVLTYARD
jgi:hypothetical protein